MSPIVEGGSITGIVADPSLSKEALRGANLALGKLDNPQNVWSRVEGSAKCPHSAARDEDCIALLAEEEEGMPQKGYRIAWKCLTCLSNHQSGLGGCGLTLKTRSCHPQTKARPRKRTRMTLEEFRGRQEESHRSAPDLLTSSSALKSRKASMIDKQGQSSSQTASRSAPSMSSRPRSLSPQVIVSTPHRSFKQPSSSANGRADPPHKKSGPLVPPALSQAGPVGQSSTPKTRMQLADLQSLTLRTGAFIEWARKYNQVSIELETICEELDIGLSSLKSIVAVSLAEPSRTDLKQALVAIQFVQTFIESFVEKMGDGNLDALTKKMLEKMTGHTDLFERTLDEAIQTSKNKRPSSS